MQREKSGLCAIRYNDIVHRGEAESDSTIHCFQFVTLPQLANRNCSTLAATAPCDKYPQAESQPHVRTHQTSAGS
jgi:aminopeptidase-like protein